MSEKNRLQQVIPCLEDVLEAYKSLKEMMGRLEGNCEFSPDHIAGLCQARIEDALKSLKHAAGAMRVLNDVLDNEEHLYYCEMRSEVELYRE